MTRFIAFTTVILLLLAGCAHQAPKPPILRGSAVFPAAASVPPGSELRVELLDVTRPNRPGYQVASRSRPISAGESSPLPFEILYPREQIDSRSYYEVTARIVHGDQVLFAADKPVRVFTYRAPKDNIQIPMKPSRTADVLP